MSRQLYSTHKLTQRESDTRSHYSVPLDKRVKIALKERKCRIHDRDNLEGE